MKMIKLMAEIFVCEQIETTDLHAASAEGITTIINNRPDDEAPGQPKSADLERVAIELGMNYVHIPIASGSFTDQDVDDFQNHCRETPGAVLAFCRSGTRSAALWALSEVKTRDVEAVLATTKAAGYDLSGMREMLASRSGIES